MLVWKIFYFPINFEWVLAGYRNLGCRFFPFSIWNISCHSLPGYRVSAERWAVKCMGIPLYVTYCFSLAAFNILSLYLVFVSLISMCFGMFYLGLSCMGLFVPLGLDWLFPFLFGEIFNYNLFKNVLIPFLFLFFFWGPYNSNVGVLDMVPEVSEAVLSSFHSFHFILLLNYFHHFIFQLTDLFFCFRFANIDVF